MHVSSKLKQAAVCGGEDDKKKSKRKEKKITIIVDVWIQSICVSAHESVRSTPAVDEMVDGTDKPSRESLFITLSLYYAYFMAHSNAQKKKVAFM